MILELVLRAIILGLEFLIRIHDDMPEPQREYFWERHEKRVQWVEGLIDRALEMLEKLAHAA